MGLSADDPRGCAQAYLGRSHEYAAQSVNDFLQVTFQGVTTGSAKCVCVGGGYPRMEIERYVR
jgi:hypothetical protein